MADLLILMCFWDFFSNFVVNMDYKADMDIKELKASSADVNNKIMVVVNPIAGTISKSDLTERLCDSLSGMGFELELRLTGKKGDATVFANEAVANKFLGVVAVGGDGTVNETANALCETDVALGIIPAGSGNGLARHLGISMDPMKAAQVIESRNIVASDYGTVNKRHFYCTFGVGFDAAVSHRFASQNRRGKMMYLKSAIDEYLHYKPQEYVISANGKVITERAFLVAICNASQYGNNAYIAPYADITDGLLDITIIHAGNALDIASVGIDLMSGSLPRNLMIDTFRTTAAVIARAEGGPAHIDGEPLSIDDTMYIQCHPGKLKIFTPLKAEQFRPIITPIKSMLNDLVLDINRTFKKS